MDRISDNETINFFYNALPLIEVLFDEDISMAITDTEKYLYTKYNKNLVLSAKEGERRPEGGAIIEVLKTGRNFIKVIPGVWCRS